MNHLEIMRVWVLTLLILLVMAVAGDGADLNDDHYSRRAGVASIQRKMVNADRAYNIM